MNKDYNSNTYSQAARLRDSFGIANQQDKRKAMQDLINQYQASLISTSDMNNIIAKLKEKLDLAATAKAKANALEVLGV